MSKILFEKQIMYVHEPIDQDLNRKAIEGRDDFDEKGTLKKPFKFNQLGSLDRLGYGFDQGVIGVLTSWNSNTYIKFLSGGLFETFDHYGIPLEFDKEYILHIPLF